MLRILLLGAVLMVGCSSTAQSSFDYDRSAAIYDDALGSCRLQEFQKWEREHGIPASTNLVGDELVDLNKRCIEYANDRVRELRD